MYRVQGWCVVLSVSQGSFWGCNRFITTLVSYKKLESLQEFARFCFLPYTAENQWTKLLSCTFSILFPKENLTLGRKKISEIGMLIKILLLYSHLNFHPDIYHLSGLPSLAWQVAGILHQSLEEGGGHGGGTNEKSTCLCTWWEIGRGWQIDEEQECLGPICANSQGRALWERM